MTFSYSGFALAAMLTAGSAGQALAQDRQASDLPPFESRSSWTGFYVGAAFGGGVMIDRVSSSNGGVGIANDDGGQGVLASVYGGYDFQVLPRALVGVLAEGTWSGIQSGASAQVPGGSASISTQPNLGWSALVRAGVLPTPSTLMYLVGGYSGQNFHASGTASAGSTTASFTRDDYFNGWTFGSGLETMLGHGWSAKLEYRFTQFETRNLPGSTLTVAPFEHAIRAGLSYKFGTGTESAGSKADDAIDAARPRWTGAYIGGAGGASAAVTRTTASFGGASSSIDGGGQGVLGSVYGGFDYQIADQAVIGVMGDLSWSNPQSTQSLSGGGASAAVIVSPSMSWSVMGRAGFLPMPSTLIYAAAGYTGENVGTTAIASGGGGTALLQSNDTLNGWTVGPGIETTISGGWSTKLEYRYSQYEMRSILGGGASIQPSTHTIRAGLAYKFGVP
jgi:outer membrane immunogenic protein